MQIPDDSVSMGVTENRIGVALCMIYVIFPKAAPLLKNKPMDMQREKSHLPPHTWAMEETVWQLIKPVRWTVEKTSPANLARVSRSLHRESTPSILASECPNQVLSTY